MKEYRERVKKGMITGVIFILAVIVLEIILNIVLTDSPNAVSKYFSYGFFTGVIIVAIYYIGKSIKALKNDDKLKEMYIEENDERNIEVQRRASQLALKIILASFAIGILVASHLDYKIYKVLLYVILCSTAIIGITTAYYKKKI